jgi:altronate dehydratase large subunit
MTGLTGFPRKDGRKGIRNVVAVVYLVECAHHVAREITLPLREHGVHLVGFPGCYPNAYAHRVLEQICTHPNVGGVLLVSLGCESFAREQLAEFVRESGRQTEVLVIQEAGGTMSTVARGREIVADMRGDLDKQKRVPMGVDELVIGTICGGSDATSGVTANPVVGKVFDELVPQGTTCIFEETGELIGCEHHMARRAVTEELGTEIVAAVDKARNYYDVLGHGSFASGNAEGELTTQEEKSMGAYAKSGFGAMHGLIKPGDVPPKGGLYLLDVIPDGEVRFGFPNISDVGEIGELMACGCHLTIFTTGRGSVVGSAVAPIIKVCGNPLTYDRLPDDMDINAGAILSGKVTLDDVAAELREVVLQTASGVPTKSERLGHQEFLLTYKQFEPLGPGCLPIG